MENHKFVKATGAPSKCDVCGKTRNAQAHRGFKSAPKVELVDSAPAETSANNAPPQSSRYASKTTADKARELTEKLKAEKADTVRLWVGWRIAHAAILLVNDKDPVVASLARKLQDTKPDSVMDRYVRLTQPECQALDVVAQKFETAGNTGPVVYSARTLRKRLAAAWK